MTVEQTTVKQTTEPELRYEKLHRPASDFNNRSDYLDHELQITNLENKRWGFFLPKKHFNFEWEDLVPGFSGAIGNTIILIGVVGAYAAGFGLSPEFTTENVRLEAVWVGIFGAILLAFLNQRTGGAGTHGWMIPLVPMLVAAGGHPLAMTIMMCLLGLTLSFLRGGSLLQALTPNGVIAGLLIFFGFTGSMDQMRALRTWTDQLGIDFLFILLALSTLLIYTLLAKVGARWAAIPACGGAAAIIALLMGAPFKFVTPPGIPNFNPFYWWGANTGWQLGLPTLEHFIAVIPFAIIAVVFWPPDAMGLIAFQKTFYPPKSENAYLHTDDCFRAISLRQMSGGLLGGGAICDPWGTLVIPAAIIKRPLPAAQIIMGTVSALAALSGYVLDIFTFPPMLRVVLLVGVFIPMIEIGIRLIKTVRDSYGAATCMATGMFINPIFGWAFATLVENFGLLGPTEPERQEQVNKVLTRRAQLVITAVTFVITTTVMAIVGMLPGVPGIMVAGN
ncbi:MAG: hypothetical protein DDT21_00799 [Syntrophomonadaceae bacterium]|nr:hypothetical protein [Bacillota bacterium]